MPEPPRTENLFMERHSFPEPTKHCTVLVDAGSRHNHALFPYIPQMA